MEELRKNKQANRLAIEKFAKRLLGYKPPIHAIAVALTQSISYATLLYILIIFYLIEKSQPSCA
jgi:hypothetical protein